MTMIADNILYLLQDEYIKDANGDIVLDVDGNKTIDVKRCGEIGEDLFLARIPDEPDNITSLIPVTPVFIANDDYEYVFQVRVRNVDYDDGYKAALNSFNYLVPRSFTVVGEKSILFKPSSPPAFVAFDDGDRAIFTYYLNCITKKDI